jgi:hypothetical protein
MAIAMQQKRSCFNTQPVPNKFLELRNNLRSIYAAVSAHIHYIIHDSSAIQTLKNKCSHEEHEEHEPEGREAHSAQRVTHRPHFTNRGIGYEKN